jgi:hypothetical protein
MGYGKPNLIGLTLFEWDAVFLTTNGTKDYTEGHEEVLRI